MSARIMIHPRCVPFTPAQGALYSALEPVYDLSAMVFFQHPSRRPGSRVELVRVVSGDINGYAMYERCDGVRFAYTRGTTQPTEVA